VGLVNSAAVVGFIDHFAVSLRGLQHRRLFAPDAWFPDIYETFPAGLT
jgi:hypothetical protein